MVNIGLLYMTSRTKRSINKILIIKFQIDSEYPGLLHVLFLDELNLILNNISYICSILNNNYSIMKSILINHPYTYKGHFKKGEGTDILL